MDNNTKNRIKIDIAGTRFTVLSIESEEYTHSVAEKLNNEINTVRRAAPALPLNSAVMLAALNICDNMTKAEEDADRLRMQIKEYLNDAAKYRSAFEEAARENDKLKKDIETYKKRLGEKTKAVIEPSPLSPAVKSVRKSSAAEAEDETEDNLTFFGSSKRKK